MATIDASGIAIRHGLGTRTQPIVNTALVGAFAAEFGLFSLDTVKAAIEDEVPMKRRENFEAAKEAFEAVRAAGPREVSHV